MMNCKRTRESGLELMRLLAIFGIVMHHACINDSIKIFTEPFRINHIPVAVLGIWGDLGVVLFFMLGYWFMLDDEYQFHIRKWLLLVMETITFALVALAVSHFGFHQPVSVKDFVKTILSPAMGTFWYVTAYLAVFLFMPFVRKLLNGLSDQALFTLFILSTIAVPLYRGGYSPAPIGDIDFAIYIVILTAAVKRYYDWFKKNSFFGAVFHLTLCVVMMIAALYTGRGQGILYSMFVNRFSFFQIMGAAFFFVCFKERVKVESKWINLLATTTLGTYVLHGSPYVATYMWQSVFHIHEAFLNNSFFVFHLIGASLIVVMVCMLPSLIIHIMIAFIPMNGSLLTKIDNRLNFERGEE